MRDTRHERQSVTLFAAHLVAIVDESLLVEFTEHPPHRLHETCVHCFVIVLKVDPSTWQQYQTHRSESKTILDRGQNDTDNDRDTLSLLIYKKCNFVLGTCSSSRAGCTCVWMKGPCGNVATRTTANEKIHCEHKNTKHVLHWLQINHISWILRLEFVIAGADTSPKTTNANWRTTRTATRHKSARSITSQFKARTNTHQLEK